MGSVTFEAFIANLPYFQGSIRIVLIRSTAILFENPRICEGKNNSIFFDMYF